MDQVLKGPIYKKNKNCNFHRTLCCWRNGAFRKHVLTWSVLYKMKNAPAPVCGKKKNETKPNVK